jgi:hypothetical protein
MIEEHDFNGFTYKIDYSKNGRNNLDIIHGKTKPDSIYKYYGISDFSIDAILKGYFYASHPFELNDDIDSSNFLLGASKPLGYDHYESFLGEAYKDLNDLKSFYKEDSASNDGFFAKGFIAHLWQVMSSKLGIISLTSQDKSNLMWPHYTQEKGIQIKFNTIELEGSIKNNIKPDECFGLYPMNYTEKLHPLDISDFEKYFVPFLYLTNIKSKAWEYEDEWRFIISKNRMGVPYSKVGLDPRKDYDVIKENRRAYYDKNIIKEVTLGNNFFTGREFIIDRSLTIGFSVEPISGDKKWNYNNHVEILNHIEQNLKDKLFLSSKTFKIDDEGIPDLVRTKERFEIEKIGEIKYKLTRTHEFY